MGIFHLFKKKAEPEYNLDSLDSINAIEIPKYDQLKGIESPVNNIEYILQRKATEHKRNGRMDLAIACLRKSNEIMPYSNFDYSKNDFLRLVEFLKLNGKADEAKNEEEKISKLYDEMVQDKAHQRNLRDDYYQQISPNINKNDKPTQRYKTKIESLGHMQNYPELPFRFENLSYIEQDHNNNERIYLFSNSNRTKAIEQILSLNRFIEEASHVCPGIAATRILESDLEFEPVLIQANYPFEFFKVEPFTKSGKTSKYPMSIYFNHDICKMPFGKNNIFGSIHLLKSGEIGKGVINQWYDNRRHSIVLSFKDNRTVIDRIEI